MQYLCDIFVFKIGLRIRFHNRGDVFFFFVTLKDDWQEHMGAKNKQS